MADETNRRAALLKAQQSFWDALIHKDVRMFEAILAPEFIARTPGQASQDRATFIQILTSFPARVESVQAEQLEIDLFGDLGVLSGVQVAELHLRDQALILNRIMITNIFQWRGDRWVMVLSHAMELRQAG